MTATVGQHPRTKAARRRQTRIAWTFALPFALVFATFMLFPLLSSFIMSFTDMTSADIADPLAVNFVGLGNYLGVLTDPSFIRAMANTGYFVLVGLPFTMIVGLTLAVALNRGTARFRTVFRVGFYLPVVTSIVAVSVVWRFILQPDGLLNGLLAMVGIHGPNWLNDTHWAMPALIVMTTWRNTGTLMIIFLAGLQAIPTDVREAARMDGASAWREFFGVTLPLLRPTLLLGAVLLSVGYLQFFEESFVMTRGGPLESTLSISYYTFNEFSFGKYGFASASSYVLFVAIALLSVLQFRVLRPKT